MDIYEKIDEIGEYIEQAKVVPVINQKLLDTNYLMKALEELYAMIPTEVKEAKELLVKQKEREEEINNYAKELMDKTRSECEKLMQVAQSESQRLVDRHEIRSKAEEQARYIQGQILEQVEQMRTETALEVDHIRREALGRARELEEAAVNKAREVKLESDLYADEVLGQIENTLTQIHALSKNSRKYFANRREQDVLQRASMN